MRALKIREAWARDPHRVTARQGIVATLWLAGLNASSALPTHTKPRVTPPLRPVLRVFKTQTPEERQGKQQCLTVHVTLALMATPPLQHALLATQERSKRLARQTMIARPVQSILGKRRRPS